MNRAYFSGLAVLLMGGATLATAQTPDEKTSQVAEAWVGHPASELLKQWPVDSGFSQSENEETDETSYSWNFGTNAYSYDEPITEQVQVGQQQGIGWVAPIMQTNVVGNNHVDVAAQQHCAVTFIANAQGIISGYEYDGVKCRPYVRNWGMPKKKK